ncbi:ergothioneine biosynthesis protein EgtB [Kangiella sp. HZ709]|uniref:ergothioneine biosynthesis protein EgtB n=1 Tax=Kangiella sp. HZ709 TaxID=2666328 RepID=UPI0012B0409F|nr:ergothioneine biosynthesis protein EgtB [Kangiella sp. HZ709]MRX26613.1 ergothioneine biosynthesis protein EgtB [Kangiella sp. HZ709]
MSSEVRFSLANKQQLIAQFLKVRQHSEIYCQPLEIEDYGLQAIADTSPVKWHLAHTSWFFETFILKTTEINFIPFNKHYEYLFNSYYNGVGEQFLRAKRSLLSRPTVKEVYEYRANINTRIVKLIESFDQVPDEVASLLILGINHEQQHQELFFTDLLYNWYQNPLLPSYQAQTADKINQGRSPQIAPIKWIAYPEQMTTLGVNNTDKFFVFDNETPQHKVYLQAFEIADRLVTNADFLQFIEANGYVSSDYWLSDGWTTVKSNGWKCPLYWFKRDGDWYQYGLNGVQPLNLGAPVSHVSAYEADAFARWSNARLPTEAEWEHVASKFEIKGNFVESGRLQTEKNEQPLEVKQLYGDVWEWTSTAYGPHPGFNPAKGAVGEYNGKFMCNQQVLKGGSCVTSSEHIRSSYRNFFYPDARWQFSGIRLARDL